MSDNPTIIVLDNLESILPDADGKAPTGAAPVVELFELCQMLLDADPATRVVFTTREPLPKPFGDKGRERVLGALEKNDAIALVSKVMARAGLKPKSTDPGQTAEEIIELVEAANCHARALVLLAPEISENGCALRLRTCNA